ncbi:MAG: alpha-glucosidase/alpha-galactosidase [Rudaea sp.]
MTKISLIGAGSTVFARTLLTDILSFPELSRATLSLFDIDAARLATSEAMAHKLAASLGVEPNIQATTDRSRALDGADYAISMIQVAGYRPGTVVDFEIPKKYGLRQTIGDTLGIGGIFRALRTIPVLLDVCRDMERLCPDVTLLQYANPMAMNCLAIERATRIKSVGLCHSVQGTAEELARQVGVPPGEVNYVCAGINHMAFYLRLEHRGRDLYPLLRQVIRDGRVPAWDQVRYHVLQRFGYFVTESSEHFAEYVPWFIKRDRPDLIERYHIPLDEYPARCEDQIAGWNYIEEALAGSDDAFSGRLDTRLNEFQNERLAQRDPARAAHRRAAMAKEQANPARGPHRSHEYGAFIIHSIETGEPSTINGNVLNDRLIDNLPDGCCVEVPCVVDKNGIQPVRVGRLPTPLAALIQTNVNVQELTVEAALTLRRERIYQAALLDPHTAAELDPDQIYALVDGLIAAHGEWLPAYE